MASRIFALIVGIDKYKSGNIWDLGSCADDAHSIKRWLTHDLHVPRDQICLLVDSQATQRGIEDSFMSHLVNNPAIEPDDAILVYFAGHGSSIRAPRGWFSDGTRDVETLCPYDFDTKTSKGRVAGICDRSFKAMLRDLSDAKGDNITVILDCSFQHPSSKMATRERRHARWTPTNKAGPDDLTAGLWRSALVQSKLSNVVRGFARTDSDTHVVLAACRYSESANESKGGGNFTHALLSVKDRTPLHKLSYADFIAQVGEAMEEQQRPVCVGKNKDRILFDGVPFLQDAHYISTDIYDSEKLRIDAGAVHGITEGTQFSIHRHNFLGSLNPVIATYSAVEIHPTWCLARSKTPVKPPVRDGWARITRWNNRTPFRVHIRRSLFTLLRRWRVCRELPSKSGNIQSKGGTVNTIRVKSASHADVSVNLRRHEVAIERHDSLVAANCRRIINLPSEKASTDLSIIDAAAHFHLHLHRKNPQRPLLGLVRMELFRLDSGSWTRISGNLLVNGRAQIVDDEKNSIYAVVLHNDSDRDLWPYLAYMESSGYGITMIYHPTAMSNAPPLRKHSQMVIGAGTADSEALCFLLSDGADSGAGFLKLFVSSAFAPMTFIEQGPPSAATVRPMGRAGKTKENSPASELWDSVVACVTVVRKF